MWRLESYYLMLHSDLILPVVSKQTLTPRVVPVYGNAKYANNILLPYVLHSS